jgi:hypothetical protein
MHSQPAASSFLGSTDRFTESPDGICVIPHPSRKLRLCIANIVVGVALARICYWGMPDAGMIGFIVSNLFGFLSGICLMCAAQAIIWIILQLPSLQIEGDIVTLYLTGWQPIKLDLGEISAVALESKGSEKVTLTLGPGSAEAFRKSLKLYDRIHFELGERLIGHGLRYTLALPAGEQETLLRALSLKFGRRLTSQAPEFAALLPRA